jgi:antitoxin component YwqK of YwqJK toxin-antitoxin module
MKKKFFESHDEYEQRVKASDREDLAYQTATKIREELDRRDYLQQQARSKKAAEIQKSPSKPKEAKEELYKNLKNDKNLVKRHEGKHELYYEINSQIPFTGIGVKKVVQKQGVMGEFKKTNFKDGKKDGISETFWNNHQLKSKSHFKEGLLDGFDEAYFSENGSLIWKTAYKEGKKHGSSVEYYRNGQLKTKTNYRKNRKTSEFEYFENGQAKRESDINFDRSCILDGEEIGKSDINDGIDRILSTYEYRDNGEMILAKHRIVHEGLWRAHGRKYEIRDFEYSSEQIVSKYDKGIKLEEWLYGIKSYNSLDTEATVAFRKFREKRYDRAEEKQREKQKEREMEEESQWYEFLGFVGTILFFFFVFNPFS